MSVIGKNDPAIIYCDYNDIKYVSNFSPSGITQTRYGNFHNDDIIGKPFGSKVYDRKNPQKWIAILRPTSDLLAASVMHRTQIIYNADSNLIVMLLNACPGKIIVEAGTGSGALTVQLADAVAPDGLVLTFEADAERFSATRNFLKNIPFASNIRCRMRDVYTDGFSIEDVRQVDSIFLDLPEPWNALPHAHKILKPLGNVVVFSPCIEQIQKSTYVFRENGYEQIRVFEALSKPWGHFYQDPMLSKKRRRDDNGEEQPRQSQPFRFVRRLIEQHPYQLPMRGHTSYMIVAQKPVLREQIKFPLTPSDERKDAVSRTDQDMIAVSASSVRKYKE